MRQNQIQYIQLRLFTKYPKIDIGDVHDEANAYGSMLPAHSQCLCLLSLVLNLNPKAKPIFNPAEKSGYLRSLPLNQARQIAGSRAKRERALSGESLEDIDNDEKDALYQWKPASDILTIQ